jgi:catechol 2,3-dioxygenase-like lactoylglutathione lyase family enzyme
MHEAVSMATIPAKDLARARKFYTEKLGLKDGQEILGGVLFETGKGTAFLLYESQFAGTNQATAMGFQVSDFEATVSDLRSRGVTFEDYDFPGLKTENGVADMPDGSKAAWFKDTEGNIIALDNGSM